MKKKDEMIGRYVIIIPTRYKRKKRNPQHYFKVGDVCIVHSKNSRYIYHLRPVNEKEEKEEYCYFGRDVHRDEFRVLSDDEAKLRLL